MQILFYKATWGLESIPTWDEKLRRVREAGYAGVEMHIGPGGMPPEVPGLLAKYQLGFVAQLIHAEADDMVRAMEAIAPHRPVRIVTHSGRDHFDFDKGCAFFRAVLDAEKRLGIPVSHETHRHRLLYSPFPTRDYLRALPDLRINADFSHWTCVCESLLQDNEDILELAIARSTHIHARVGHEEGPQVHDPRAPEYARHLDRFCGWWDRIVAARQADGTESLIVVPEFGPWPYMPALPYTVQPVADLWDVCLWMANHLRARWNVEKYG